MSKNNQNQERAQSAKLNKIIDKKRPSSAPLQNMFEMSTGKFQQFGIKEYQIHKKYCDPLKQIQEKNFIANKKNKGQKSNKYVTARGSYLDLYEKWHPKKFPGPQHPTFYKKKETKERQLTSKEKMKFKKMSYIDYIQKEEKKNPRPGPGTYNVRKTEKQINEQIKQMKLKKNRVSERTNFLCDIEYIGIRNPGVGNYNPIIARDIQSAKTSEFGLKMKPKDWIKKHQKQEEQQKKKGKEKGLDMGIYNPFPVSFNTFGKLKEIIEQKKKKKEKFSIQNFGKEERFKDVSKMKGQVSIVPAPNKYDLAVHWPGKQDIKKSDKVKKNWLNTISKGFTQRVYYNH